MLNRKRSMARTYFLNLIGVALASIVTVGIFWFGERYLDFRHDIAGLHEEVYQADKQQLQQEVDKVFDYIEYMRSLTEQRLRDSIRSRVDEAAAIAQHIYDRNHGKLPDAEIQERIIEALRPIRFNEGRGYYFITSLDGIEMLFADRPEMEGQNLWEMESSDGVLVIQEMAALCRDQGAGFVEYNWTKPNRSGSDHFKIAYVKYFPPFDWLIGTGEYLDDVTADIQQETIARVDEIKFGRDGYVFAGTYEGVSLSGPAKGQNMLIGGTEHNQQVVADLIEAAQAGGGFVQYRMPALDGQRPDSKLSYARGVSDWQWYIGAGMYIGQIEEEIASRRAMLLRELLINGGFILLVFIGIMAIWLGSTAYFSRAIDAGLRRFIVFFDRASREHTSLDPQDQPFREYAVLAEAANKMVAERSRVEAALRMSEEQFRAVFDNSLAGIAVVSTRGEIMDCNQNFAAMLGYEREELHGMLIKQIMTDEEFAEEQKLVQDVISGNVPGIRFEKQYLHRNGDQVPVEVFLCRVHGDDDKTDFLIGIIADISDRRRLESRLRQAQKMEAIGVLAGGIAHDFNNLLFAIIGNADLAQESLPADHEASAKIQEITTASQRAAEMVRQILTFARQRKFQRERMDLKPLVVEVGKLIRSALPANIDVDIKLPSEPVVISGDVTQIHQVLMNLCTNASYEMTNQEGRGQLELRLEIEEPGAELIAQHGIEAGRYARITVSDTGPGIDEAILPRIFDPFFTTKDIGQGTGMGLAVVHGTVTSLDGFVEAHNRLSGGATFAVWLPLATEASPPRAAESRQLPLGNERVWIVDDEPAITGMIEQMLCQLGYQVRAFIDSRAALRQFQAESDLVDAMIVDQAMPDLTGSELVREVLAIKPGLPIILCTGFSQSLTPDRAKELGINQYLLKPLTRRQIAEALRQALDDRLACGERL
ncbi:cache domain-containing protein [bacterium]|nr:cache domain-containing protein [bacterium]